MTAPGNTYSSLSACGTTAMNDHAAGPLRRLRWAVRATLTLGVAASVAANVLHARPNPISQIIAAWPPMALLLTVELISRVPHHRRSLGAIRIAATAVIAGIATWVSYWHLVGVAARYGESGHGAAYLLPISVDGLVIVASVSLVEITARIRATASPMAAAPAATTERSTVAAPPAESPHTPAARPLAVPSPAPDELATTPTSTEPVAAAAAAGNPPAAQTPTADRGKPSRPDHTATVAATTRAKVPIPTPTPAVDAATAQHPLRPTADTNGDDRAQPPSDTGPNHVPTDTAAAVAYWRRRDPELHPADIATRIGRSERTVRRHWSPPATSGAPHTNGHPANSLRP